jgi:hypothetical protein
MIGAMLAFAIWAVAGSPSRNVHHQGRLLQKVSAYP